VSSEQKSSLNEYPDDKIATLFRQYQRTRSTELRDRLTLLHMNLVRFLAGKFANRGEPLEDLIQVGTIGLLNAIDRYDPDRGTKFSTYATPTIMGEIKRYFRDKSWNLKVPRHLQELNWAATKAVDQLSQQLGRSPTLHEIAKHIGATEEETIEAIELGNAHETVSLDTKLTLEGDTVPLTHGEMIGGEDEGLQNVENYEDLRAAIENLENREKAIILFRFFKDLSQTEVAKRLNISQMHVSRLQAKALQRLKTMLAEEQK
jgi:RNA polymerase sigma-B factor